MLLGISPELIFSEVSSFWGVVKENQKEHQHFGGF